MPRSLCSLAMTKRPVILNAKRERIRNPLERETDCRGAKAPRNDTGVRNGLPRTYRWSRLPARSVLLLRRGVHRTPAPQ